METVTSRTGDRASDWRGLFLATAGILAVAAAVVWSGLNAPSLRAQTPATQASTAQTASERPAFEVASIKVNHSTDGRFFLRVAPGRFTVADATVKMLINF